MSVIRVRFDDILVPSEPFNGRELKQFKKHHNWCLEAPHLFYPTAAILCSEIQQFPEAIEYIRGELDAHRLYVDLHGWQHIDYATLSQEEIEEHLEKSFEFFLKTFNCLPVRWATPWGARSPEIDQACRKFSLIPEGVTLPVVDQGQAMGKVKEMGSIDCLQGKVIMVHWFERGLKLFRIVQTGIHGSWEEAAKVNPKEFGD
jgi:peptidoglycan/xylan/chitin deacetylase (PgdA/CDA1 family)